MDIRMKCSKNNQMSYEGSSNTIFQTTPIQTRISNLIINDLTIQPYSKPKQTKLLEELLSGEYHRVIVQTYGQDEHGNMISEQEKQKKSEIVVSLDMTISELKSLILSYFGNKPFFLDYLIDNKKTVRDLLAMIKADGKEENIINIYFDIENLRLNFRN